MKMPQLPTSIKCAAPQLGSATSLLGRLCRLVAFFTLFSPISLGEPTSVRQGRMPDHPSITIRQATDSDLDALSWIGISAFPHEPQWPYRYPYAAQFPRDHLMFTRIRYSEWIEASNTGDCVIMVAEVPSMEDESQSRVVSMSIWRIPRVDKVPSVHSQDWPRTNEISSKAT